MKSEACCGSDIILFHAERNLEPRYMGYALDCSLVAAQKAAMGRGIAVMHIHKDHLKCLKLPIPPRHEQGLIADFLDEDLSRMDATISKVTTAVERLQEFRSALVTAAVTGSVDVRRESPDGVEGHVDVVY